MVSDAATPPQDIDAERALLGVVLSGYADLPALSRLVSGADFYRPAHEQIWDACLAVHATGVKPGPITVRNQLGNQQTERIGGATYLSDLFGDLRPATDAAHYAEIIRNLAIRRQVVSMGMRFQQLGAADNDETTESLLARCRQWMSDIEGNRPQGRVSVMDSMATVLDIVDQGATRGMCTPWVEVEDLLHGIRPGQLVVFGARTSVGKSIALENLATHIARDHQLPVLFTSLEMSHVEVTQRTLAWSAKVDLSRLIEGGSRLSEAEKSRIDAASGSVLTSLMEYDDRSGQTVNDIRSAAWDVKQAAVRAGRDLGGVFVDYVQLVRSLPTHTRLSRQQQIGEITRSLKQLAKELDCPVVTAAQVNRGPESRQDKTPLLSDLREAGDIENDADVVVLLHEELVEDGDRTIATGDLDMIVAKNRNGPKGMVTVKKWGHYARLGAA